MRRSFAPFLPLLLVVTAATPRALPEPRGTWSGTSTLASDSEARWVAFDLTPGNQIRFRMQLDGREITAVLDTGVSYSVLARHYAQTHRLAIRAEGQATVIGGSVDVGRVDTATVTLGGLTRRGGSLAVADLPAAATGSATAVDLLVGRDLTAAYALDIDYAARRFRLLRSGRLPFAGVRAPLTIAPDRLVYVSEVTLGRTRLRPMVVDTGDGSSITLGATGWAAAGAAVRAVPTTTTVSFGLAGAVVSELAIVPRLLVGGATAREVEVRVEPAGGFSDTIGVAGRIGSGFLQRYRVLLDPGAGHMLLGSGAAAAPATVRSTSGLLLGLAADRLKVLHVMRGSPAAATGWRAGDTICAVDGVAITPAYAAAPLAGWATAAPGRAVRLTACDGAERVLTLRRFY
ncbi:aspartyl protease family protein [Sphingomonas sp. BK235]|uniref:aspartyl protease family protein n=1 Tax=Sphingomonas sp. BK235 TaxID=2512131 RepID=UPI0010DE0354|nr:aspartyl protease family protein [Sphingomonas sp. BK235]TCP33220.1 aspartyl protease [Sphingomonas sp. BK235]